MERLIDLYITLHICDVFFWIFKFKIAYNETDRKWFGWKQWAREHKIIFKQTTLPLHAVHISCLAWTFWICGLGWSCLSSISFLYSIYFLYCCFDWWYHSWVPRVNLSYCMQTNLKWFLFEKYTYAASANQLLHPPKVMAILNMDPFLCMIFLYFVNNNNGSFFYSFVLHFCLA